MILGFEFEVDLEGSRSESLMASPENGQEDASELGVEESLIKD